MNRVGLWLTFFGGLVAMNPTQSEAYALPKMVALGIGLALIWAGARTARRTVLDGPILALWAVAIASTVVSGDWPTAVFGIYGQPYHGLLAMAICSLAFYAGASGGKELLDQAMIPLILAMAVMSVFAFGQFYGHVPESWATIGGRVISTTGHPVLLGAVLCVVLPFMLGTGRSIAPAVIVVLAMTGARGSILAAACGVGVYFVVMRRVRVRTAIASVALVAAVVVGFTMLRGQRKMSDAFRTESARVAMRAVAKAPILGYGPDCFVNALRANRDERYMNTTGGNLLMSAKNDFVQAAATLGILGLAAYIWLFLVLLTRVFEFSRFSEFMGGVLIETQEYRMGAAIAGSLAAAVVNSSWNLLPIEAMVIVCFAAGVLCLKEGEVSPRLARGLRLASVIVALVTAQLCAANIAMTKGIAAWEERDFKRAAQMMRAAVYLAPWEIEYVSKRCEEIYLLARFVTPKESKDFMGRAVRASVKMVEMAPANASSWELLASTYWQASYYLGPHLLRDAHRAISRAQELDPFFEFTAQRKREIERDMARRLGAKG